MFAHRGAPAPGRIIVAAASTFALAVAALLGAGPAAADSAPADPTNPATPATVTADALPTVQIDGVVWQQVIVGDTVYAAGKFTTARPAGSPAGQNTVTRNNLLAYSLSTGTLIPSFAPSLNAQALGIAASPDGSRIYVVGDFTTVDGAPHYRAAAFSTATGAIDASFAPIFSAQTRSVVATNSSVYIGGIFSSVASGGVTQSRGMLAQLTSTGAVTSFRADADASVDALTLTHDGVRLVVGGRFQKLSGVATYGLGAVSPSTGASMSWAANQTVRNAGTKSSITSLTSDADGVYGSGYVFGAGGNLEGSFRADASGNLTWLESCHGDTYSVYPSSNAVYAVGHPHYCGNVPSGFPETSPRSYHRGIAFSKAVTGVNKTEPYTSSGYSNFAGKPAPSLLHWFPELAGGTFTGQSQAAWTVTGNGQYVVMGGEFPTVNGVAQQGLVRFAVASVAPNAVGPLSFSSLLPALSSTTPGRVSASWTSTWDYDNLDLTYRLFRDGSTTPVFTVAQASRFDSRPGLGFTDTGLVPGSKHYYKITVTDPLGNVVATGSPSITVAGSAPAPQATASDDFGRAVGSGWGSADSGGAWTTAGTVGDYSVDGAAGQMLVSPGSTRSAALGGVSTASADVATSVSLDRLPTGGGVFLSAVGRQAGSASYVGRAWVTASGSVQVQLLQGSTTLTSVTVPNLAYTPTSTLRMRVQVTGMSPTTLRARVWNAASAEPTSWQASTTDSTAGLQTVGSVGLQAYLSGSATSPSPVIRWDGFRVASAG